MAFLTDRKRAAGHGSAKTGTAHHWSMTVSSVALLFLVPVFIFVVGPMLGQPHDMVTAYFAKPFPALVVILTMTVGLLHFKNGVRTLIEDYVHGHMRAFLIIVMACISYAAIATSIFAILRIAL